MFDEFALPGFLLDAVAQLGWEEPTPIQKLVLPPALEGRDVLGGAPTGTGKSAAFLLPIIARLAQRPRQGVQCIILEPTRELAEQISSVAQKLLQVQDEAISAAEGEITEPIGVATVIGGADRVRQRENLATIICATPGRLLEFLQKGWLEPKTVEILIIDEADRMLDMGFRDDIAAITRKLTERYQTMLFSATLEGFGVRDFARNVLNNPVEIILGANGSNLAAAAASGEEGAAAEAVATGAVEKLPELLQGRAYYAASDLQKDKILLHLLTTVKARAIVFVRTKDHLAHLSAFLKRQGMSFATLKGESSQLERTAALRRFRDGEVNLMLATDVASRGLDIDDVEYVYNYDLPQQSEIYVHRAGRTARAGAKGVVVSLVMATEFTALERIERYTQRPIERRAIKGLCASFAEVGANHPSEKKRSRANPHGGFAKKAAANKDEQKPRKKVRLRDKKNKGKPDFAAKRAKKAARLQEQALAASAQDSSKAPSASAADAAKE